jgi:hypothetical protein
MDLTGLSRSISPGNFPAITGATRCHIRPRVFENLKYTEVMSYAPRWPNGFVSNHAMFSRFQVHASEILGAVLAIFLTGCSDPTVEPSSDVEVARASSSAAGGLVDLEGRRFDLWELDKDRAATVIVFTRTDCPISNRYAPTVKRLHEMYEPRGVTFYLAYVDPKETSERIRQHRNDFDYPCPAFRDTDHSLVNATGATVTPEAVVYGANREIVYRGRIDNLYAEFGQSRDAATTHELADAIEAALAGRPAPQSVTEAVGCPISDLK